MALALLALVAARAAATLLRHSPVAEQAGNPMVFAGVAAALALVAFAAMLLATRSIF